MYVLEISLLDCSGVFLDPLEPRLEPLTASRTLRGFVPISGTIFLPAIVLKSPYYRCPLEGGSEGLDRQGGKIEETWMLTDVNRRCFRVYGRLSAVNHHEYRRIPAKKGPGKLPPNINIGNRTQIPLDYSSRAACLLEKGGTAPHI